MENKVPEKALLEEVTDDSSKGQVVIETTTMSLEEDKPEGGESENVNNNNEAAVDVNMNVDNKEKEEESSSSSESEDDSDDDNEKGVMMDEDTPEEQEYKLKKMLETEKDNMVEGFGPTTEHEKLPTEVELNPLPDDVVEDEEIELCGQVMSYNESRKSVIVKSLPVFPGEEIKAIDQDSVICTEERVLVGRIEEVFGPIVKPFYIVRLMGSYVQEKNSDGGPELVNLQQGEELYVVKKHGAHVDTSKLNQKGSDASNVFDEEPPEDELEFSDDEQEMLAKKKKKEQRRQGSKQQNSNINGQQTFLRRNNNNRVHQNGYNNRNRNFQQNQSFNNNFHNFHHQNNNQQPFMPPPYFQNQPPPNFQNPPSNFQTPPPNFQTPPPNFVSPPSQAFGVPYFPPPPQFQQQGYQQYWHQPNMPQQQQQQQQQLPFAYQQQFQMQNKKQ